MTQASLSDAYHARSLVKYAFRNEEEMKYYKVNFPGHEYCVCCNLDFENQGDIMMHKIKSRNRISC